MQQRIGSDAYRQVPAIDPVKHLGKARGCQTFADHEAILFELGQLGLIQAKVGPTETSALGKQLGIDIEVSPKLRRGRVPGQFV